MTEFDQKVADLEAAIEALKEEIAELKAEVSSLNEEE